MEEQVQLHLLVDQLTCQMHEQLLYELPDIGDASPEVYRSSAHKASGKKPNPKMGATAAYVGGHFPFQVSKRRTGLRRGDHSANSTANRHHTTVSSPVFLPAIL